MPAGIIYLTCISVMQKIMKTFSWLNPVPGPSTDSAIFTVAKELGVS
jgi:hypothetical protein